MLRHISCDLLHFYVGVRLDYFVKKLDVRRKLVLNNVQNGHCRTPKWPDVQHLDAL